MAKIRFLIAMILMPYIGSIQVIKAQPGNAVVSPEIGADGTVTFRLNAPNANEVIVAGESIKIAVAATCININNL